MSNGSQVFIGDNGSVDDSVAFLKEQFPDRSLLFGSKEEQKEQQRSSYKRAKRGDYNRQGRQPRGNFSASFKDSMLR